MATESQVPNELLLQAISSGSVDGVKGLLDGGNSHPEGAFPSLQTCLEHDRLEIAQILIDAGTNIDARDSKGRTILFYAIEKMKKEFFNFIINCGADINASDDEHITPLHVASENWGCEDYMKTLLEKGANVDAVCHCGNTPLHCALTDGSSMKVKILLEYHPNVTMPEYVDLVDYIIQYDPLNEAVSMLLGYGFTLPNHRIEDREFLFKAVSGGLYEVVELLLLQGANSNGSYYDCTMLEAACQAGHTDIVELLIESGVDLENAEEAFVLAVMSNHCDVVKLLLKSKTPKCSGLLLYIALEFGSVDMLKCLLENMYPCPNVNSSFNGRTLAHLAVDHSRPEAIELLWSYDADFNIGDSKGHRPLHYACRTQQSKIVKTLLQFGADVNVTNHEGATCVEFLGDSHEGDTALFLREHIAALHAAGLYVSEQCFSFMLRGNKDILLKYNSEVDAMKTAIISTSEVSFYKLIKCSDDKIIKNLKNSHVNEINKSKDYKKLFHNYANLLQTKLKSVLKKRNYIDEAVGNMISLVECLRRFPLNCLERILFFFSNEELGILNGYYRPREEILDMSVLEVCVEKLRTDFYFFD